MYIYIYRPHEGYVPSDWGLEEGRLPCGQTSCSLATIGLGELWAWQFFILGKKHFWWFGKLCLPWINMMIHPKLVMFHSYVKSPCFNSHTSVVPHFRHAQAGKFHHKELITWGALRGSTAGQQPMGYVACYWDRPLHHTAEVPFHHEGLGATRLSFFRNPSGSRDLPDETHLFPLHKSMTTKDPNTCF